MGRTACTEPQCLYKGALYLYLTVELYLYSPYGPYGLYRASVPVQGCTLPFFYSEDGNCAENCSSKLIVKYTLYRIVHSLELTDFVDKITMRGMNNMEFKIQYRQLELLKMLRIRKK